MINIDKITNGSRQATISGAPEGFDGHVLAEIARTGRTILFVARDDRRAAAVATALGFFGDDIELIHLPAWDCLPYDRVSPRPDIVARRIHALTMLATRKADAKPAIVLTTVAAITQRVTPTEYFQDAVRDVAPGPKATRDDLLAYLERYGYGRAETVMEAGDYAVRGGIVDVFVPGYETPLRLDFFGDTLDSIRTFEAISQRTIGTLDKFHLKPIGEVTLDEASVSRFRTGYRALFGSTADDALYESISERRRFSGMEHWLPLFHDHLASVLDFAPDALVVLDHQSDEAFEARQTLIQECYDARAAVGARGLAIDTATYHPLPPDRLYIPRTEWTELLAARTNLTLHPFDVPEGRETIDAGGRPGRDFSDARARPDRNVYDETRAYIADERKAGRVPVLAAVSEGTRDRLLKVLGEHGLSATATDESWSVIATQKAAEAWAIVLDIEKGFTGPGIAMVSERDILGDRIGGSARRKVRAENFIAETSVLNEGDLVVHVDYGIGRYLALKTLTVTGAPHDCLEVEYSTGKLFVPVENIEVLSRYGDDAGEVRLDSLGGAGWQARKAKLKNRIREMADKLIQIAAEREMRPGEVYQPAEGVYDEFINGFPYQETDDQDKAIGDVIADLASGRPMDRLVCGDVGFGKTEVALRAAFVAAMEGRQVAVVVPTTLLARQHHRNFATRFQGFPLKVGQLSRLVTPKDAKATKDGLKSGNIDIVVGTHAILAKDIQFKRLGLLIVDEEQHFGVAHKERLKQMKTDVHVLTMTATPIPRTLQLALSGVRELSLITTPPVDRLAVRTFVLPFDPVVIAEAIRRERFRGGQCYYVCPRIADLAAIEETLKEIVPEIKIAVAHGKLAPTQLEDVMTAFDAGQFDLLLSTNIIESGIDLPTVNTIIIHRADMFGLAQLYQLRGRIGRSKARGYAYLTLPAGRVPTAAAQKRLEVMQTLDSLGAGFMLASHDLDIRGAGNLLGEEQSGHIREVGIELYQQMLEEAVTEARESGADRLGPPSEEQWSPHIEVGIPVLIPAEYVPDLGIRLGLYRRVAQLTRQDEIDAFAAEMIDRFGSLPPEVDNLMATVAIKQLCKEAGVSRVEAGPKGAVISFHNDRFANVDKLVAFITSNVGTAKLRPDQKLVFMRTWDDGPARLKGVTRLMSDLSKIAA